MTRVMRLAVRGSGVLLFSLVFSFLGISPALAWPSNDEPGSYGAQPQCNTRPYVVGDIQGHRLRRIILQPPTHMTVDYPGQTVGWRFVVQTADAQQNPLPWKRIFASRIEKTVAPESGSPVFQAMTMQTPWKSAILTWPFPRIWYRAIVTFYWYDPSGEVVRSERWTPEFYNRIEDNQQIIQADICDQFDNIPT